VKRPAGARPVAPRPGRRASHRPSTKLGEIVSGGTCRTISPSTHRQPRPSRPGIGRPHRFQGQPTRTLITAGRLLSPGPRVPGAVEAASENRPALQRDAIAVHPLPHVPTDRATAVGPGAGSEGRAPSSSRIRVTVYWGQSGRCQVSVIPPVEESVTMHSPSEGGKAKPANGLPDPARGFPRSDADGRACARRPTAS
jgi:hypothetical protein